MKYVVYFCRTIKILISHWPRKRKFSQLLPVWQTVAFDFAHDDHALVTLFVQFLCCVSDSSPVVSFCLSLVARGVWWRVSQVWLVRSKFDRWVLTKNLCSVLNLVYFDSWSWQSFVSTCDVFNCLFPLDVQNEIQLLSGVFCYLWLVCLLGFWLRIRHLSKSAIRFRMASFSFFTLLDA